MQKFLEQNPALQKFLELNPVSQKFLERIYNSYQDFIAALNRGGVSDFALWMLKLCRLVLGSTPSTRTMVGEQQLREPFFNHGNLIGKDVSAVISAILPSSNLFLGRDCGKEIAEVV
ncbi:hypothetical protein FOBRF1_013333 [Fusarium oxysporum]